MGLDVHEVAMLLSKRQSSRSKCLVLGPTEASVRLQLSAIDLLPWEKRGWRS